MSNYILNCIPNLITEDDNKMLIMMPLEEEIKEFVFRMSIDSSAGPDGFNGKLFQATWDIIKHDIIEFVTKFYSHTCITLIPKVDSPSRFEELRPISLSNYTSGFISGRLITENVMLAQEIIHDISKPNRGGNIVMKLDMAKDYDRLSWSFLIDVLNKFGFCKEWSDMIWRMFSNVCLIHKENFTSFSMNKRGLQINHLAYADDIVIFCGGNSKTVKMVMKEIRKYEKASDQLVNKDKSFFLTGPKANAHRINRLRDCIGFVDKSFPFTYLGCPIYIGRKKICYFDNMVTRVVKRLNRWQDEGGIGIKSLEDISNTLTIKRWWRFKTKPSLWADFLRAKYCPRSHPVKKKWISGNSQAWKNLLLARDKAEGNITWLINSGDCNFWWDNWTMTDPLAYSNANIVTNIGNNTNICEFISYGGWDMNKLRNILTNQMVEVISNINIGQPTDVDDVVWNITEDGQYSNKFAWHTILN
uniref:Reverse transcriptase domain-containing protein n=1 Tax=Nicotiana tabacum TaxID=4097 RepID=A0A1S4ABG0_TOBAC|nr:PREDICTED: uncharacterized protein LOC107795721 [Nicotiana tabacum]